jgi:imidazolonepropionase-like amidohydrolase/ABC-type multidrug transport system permease subunit
MNAYLAQIAINLKLTFRDRSVIFFNYLFPLVFFFIFAQLFHAERGGAIVQVFTMVLTIGVLGTGFFGAGIRSVQDREANILRRFKVAPISAAPILVSSLVTGLFNFLPSAVLMLLLSHFVYGMAYPQRMLSLLVFLSLGVLAFRALGSIIGSVANSMQESQIVIQILYIPMLFLSGATIPMSVLPGWVQVLAQYLPATHLMTGMQAILGRGETLAQNVWPALALILTTILGTFIGVKLFRWEKGEKIKGSAKLWLLGVLAPFLVLGTWQAYSHDSVTKSKLIERDLRRVHTRLIRGARIIIGDGRVIESGGVLIRKGKIEQVYDGATPDPNAVRADVIEASGKTVLPGFIDVHVHLAASGGLGEAAADMQPDKIMPRELAAYLYSGVMSVKSVGDPLDSSLKARALTNSGERLGAELFVCGPMFTAAGGHGTEYFRALPDNIRRIIEEQTLRLPKTAEEARRQVDELKRRGVDGIKAILESGGAGMLFNRLDGVIFKAVAEEARAQSLPIVVHTGDARDVAQALDAGVNGIEHGSTRDRIPDETFARMKALGVTYDPTLVVIEDIGAIAAGTTEPLDRPLVLQVGPASLIASTKKVLASEQGAKMRAGLKNLPFEMETAKDNLRRAWRAGVILVTGSDSGNPLTVHGPAVHREMQLWVEAGLPPAVALQASTYNAARLLRAEQRIGLIAKGHEASLLIVDGNPLKDIKLTEGIQTLIFKGEHVDRTDLFDQN